MIDTPRTDALVGNFDFPWSFDTETLVRHAETLERELAERLRDVNALMSDIRKGDEMLMAWFKAASPYATPGSLEEGLKKLQGMWDKAEDRCPQCGTGIKGHEK